MDEAEFFCVKCREWSPEPLKEPSGVTMYVTCPKCGHRMRHEDHSVELLKAPPTHTPED